MFLLYTKFMRAIGGSHEHFYERHFFWGGGDFCAMSARNTLTFPTTAINLTWNTLIAPVARGGPALHSALSKTDFGKFACDPGFSQPLMNELLNNELLEV